MHPLKKIVITLLASAATGTQALPPGFALVPPNPETIKHAIYYGLSMKGKGFQRLLGPNWKVDTRTGTLLNVYSPYMQLAAKAYSVKGIPPRTKLDDAYKTARPKLEREILYLKDEKIPKSVKFSASLLGKQENFLQGWQAHIEGFKGGQAYRLKPSKQVIPAKAGAAPSGRKGYYEGVMGLYFPFKQLASLEGEFKLILTPKQVLEEEKAKQKAGNEDMTPAASFDPENPYAQPVIFRFIVEELY